MLSEESYQAALYTYLCAAALIVLYLGWWLGRRWPPFLAALTVFLVAALLMTPAYPDGGVSTMAPALIVAGFLILTSGVDSAVHALRPLAMSCAFAFALSLLLYIVWFRPRSRRRANASPADASS